MSDLLVGRLEPNLAVKTGRGRCGLTQTTMTPASLVANNMAPVPLRTDMTRAASNISYLHPAALALIVSRMLHYATARCGLIEPIGCSAHLLPFACHRDTTVHSFAAFGSVARPHVCTIT